VISQYARQQIWLTSNGSQVLTTHKTKRMSIDTDINNDWTVSRVFSQYNHAFFVRLLLLAVWTIFSKRATIL